MLTIHADVQQTRRKRFCHVFGSDQQTVLFSSRSLLQCIEWVLDRGDNEFKISGPEGPLLYAKIYKST